MPRLLAAVYDRLMKATEDACLAAWRSELLSSLFGAVLEIGAGTGVNLAYYPVTITRLVLAEPDPAMRQKLLKRIEGHALEVSDSSAEELPWADGSFDAVVSTLVLCSVTNPERALAEIHRVLKPGGRLIFVEHVAAETSARLRWQRWVEPVWKRTFGNCHLTRDTEQAIRRAGFELAESTREGLRKAFPLMRPSIRGVARRPL